MVRGVDASMDCAPYIGTLRSLGVGFVGRYYCNLALTNNPAKVLTPREAHSLCGAGFSIIAVWEYLNTPGYFSGSQGLADGDYAYKYAAEVIHQPENSAIYFAVDFDASETQFRQLIAPYFQGVMQAFANAGNNRPLYSVGAYGSGAVIAALKQSAWHNLAGSLTQADGKVLGTTTIGTSNKAPKLYSSCHSGTTRTLRKTNSEAFRSHLRTIPTFSQLPSHQRS